MEGGDVSIINYVSDDADQLANSNLELIGLNYDSGFNIQILLSRSTCHVLCSLIRTNGFLA